MVRCRHDGSWWREGVNVDYDYDACLAALRGEEGEWGLTHCCGKPLHVACVQPTASNGCPLCRGRMRGKTAGRILLKPPGGGRPPLE